MSALALDRVPRDQGMGRSLLARALALSVLAHLGLLALVNLDGSRRDAGLHEPAIAVSLLRAPAVTRLAAVEPGRSQAVQPPGRSRPVSTHMASPPSVARTRSAVRERRTGPVAPDRARARRVREPPRHARAASPGSRASVPPAPVARSRRSAATASPATGRPGPATGQPVVQARSDSRPPGSPTGISRGPRPVAGNPPPRYPPRARRRGLEGKVLIGLNVNVDGSARDTVVVHSSGVAMLDRAALTAVAAWRFEPALDRGRAIPAPLRVPVVFRLDRRG